MWDEHTLQDLEAKHWRLPVSPSHLLLFPQLLIFLRTLQIYIFVFYSPLCSLSLFARSSPELPTFLDQFNPTPLLSSPLHLGRRNNHSALTAEAARGKIKMAYAVQSHNTEQLA